VINGASFTWVSEPGEAERVVCVPSVCCVVFKSIESCQSVMCVSLSSLFSFLGFFSFFELSSSASSAGVGSSNDKAENQSQSGTRCEPTATWHSSEHSTQCRAHGTHESTKFLFTKQSHPRSTQHSTDKSRDAQIREKALWLESADNRTAAGPQDASQDN
jgi:hypothetical protein